MKYETSLPLTQSLKPVGGTKIISNAVMRYARFKSPLFAYARSDSLFDTAHTAVENNRKIFPLNFTALFTTATDDTPKHFRLVVGESSENMQLYFVLK